MSRGEPRGPRPDRYDRAPRGDRYDRGPRAEYVDHEPATEPEPPGVIEIDPALEPATADTQNFATPADAVAPIAAEILQQLLAGMRFRGRITRHDAEEEAAVNAGNDDHGGGAQHHRAERT